MILVATLAQSVADPEGDDPIAENLQAYLDQQTHDLDRSIRDSANESDDDE